jgi:transcriptional antiterminator NusG
VIDETREGEQQTPNERQPETAAQMPAETEAMVSAAPGAANDPNIESHQVDEPADVEVAAPEDDEIEEEVPPAGPLELVDELVRDEVIQHKWYILKVASNRENSIADALRRRVKVEGVEDYFDQIVVPTEDVVEFKNGKKKIVKRKLYPGYICVHMHINDDTWFLVRDTPGIGDFTGAAGKPSEMLPHEVERILPKAPGEETQQAARAIPFKVADRVRIKEGTFENFEGDVENVDEANGRVTVGINIFDRRTPVEIDYWQLESV